MPKASLRRISRCPLKQPGVLNSRLDVSVAASKEPIARRMLQETKAISNAARLRVLERKKRRRVSASLAILKPLRASKLCLPKAG